jgi:hypothetical protein
LDLRIARAKTLTRRLELALERFGSGQGRLELRLEAQLVVLELIALNRQKVGQG